MLNAAITYLNTLISATGYFGQTQGLVVLVKKDDTQYPAFYCGSGEYKKVSDFDQANGTTYWRLRSEPTDTEFESPTQVDTLLRRTYPLRLVCAVLRSTINTDNDNAYTEDKLSLAVQKVLKDREQTLMSTLSVDGASILFRGVNTNANDVFSTELINVSSEIQARMLLMSIDIDLVLDYRGTCISDFCDDDVDVDAVIRGDVIDEITANPSLLTPAQTDAIEEAFCDLPAETLTYVIGFAPGETAPYSSTVPTVMVGDFTGFTLTNCSAPTFELNDVEQPYTGTTFDSTLTTVASDILKIAALTITDSGQYAYVQLNGSE